MPCLFPVFGSGLLLKSVNICYFPLIHVKSVNFHEFPLFCVKISLDLWKFHHKFSNKIRYFRFSWIKTGFHHLTSKNRDIGDCLGTPNPYNLSEKYWRYTSNLYRSTPLICNAVPPWLQSFGDKETPQYTSNLYCSTPPIYTAVRLPFVPAILLRELQGLGVPESSWDIPEGLGKSDSLSATHKS